MIKLTFTSLIVSCGKSADKKGRKPKQDERKQHPLEVLGHPTNKFLVIFNLQNLEKNNFEKKYFLVKSKIIKVNNQTFILKRKVAGEGVG